MIAVRKVHAAPGITISEVPEPVRTPGHVLVQVDTVGICGSDIHIADWDEQYTWLANHLPVTIGHEIVGTVVESCHTSAIHPGTRVAVRPALACATCSACLDGQDQRCVSRVRMGLEIDGGLTQTLNVHPRQLYPIAHDVDSRLAALIEPLTVGYHAISRIESISPKSAVAVIGAGAVALGIMSLLHAQGVRNLTVFGTPADDALGSFALASEAGISTVDVTTGEAAQLADSFTHVFVAAGAKSAVPAAIDLLKRGGNLVVVALGIGPVEVNIDTLVRREISFIPSFGSTASDWTAVTELINAGSVPDLGIVSDEFPLRDSATAFKLLAARASRKIIIRPNSERPLGSNTKDSLHV